MNPTSPPLPPHASPNSMNDSAKFSNSIPPLDPSDPSGNLDITYTPPHLQHQTHGNSLLPNSHVYLSNPDPHSSSANQSSTMPDSIVTSSTSVTRSGPGSVHLKSRIEPISRAPPTSFTSGSVMMASSSPVTRSPSLQMSPDGTHDPSSHQSPVHPGNFSFQSWSQPPFDKTDSPHVPVATSTYNESSATGLKDEPRENQPSLSDSSTHMFPSTINHTNTSTATEWSDRIFHTSNSPLDHEKTNHSFDFGSPQDNVNFFNISSATDPVFAPDLRSQDDAPNDEFTDNDVLESWKAAFSNDASLLDEDEYESERTYNNEKLGEDEPTLTAEYVNDEVTFVFDDGEGFLEDTLDENCMDSVVNSSSSPCEREKESEAPCYASNDQTPSILDQTSASYMFQPPGVGSNYSPSYVQSISNYGPYAASVMQPVSAPKPVESSVDKPKEGYQLAFDLPPDIDVRPRRRVTAPFGSTYSSHAPVPSPTHQSDLKFNLSSQSPGPSSPAFNTLGKTTTTATGFNTEPLRKDFFEDLPDLIRPRPASVRPHANPYAAPPRSMTRSTVPPPPPSQPMQDDIQEIPSISMGSVREDVGVTPVSCGPSSQSTPPPPPPHYSHTTQPTKPPSNRYSPVPAASTSSDANELTSVAGAGIRSFAPAGALRSNALPYAPRTSSPLVNSTREPSVQPVAVNQANLRGSSYQPNDHVTRKTPPSAPLPAPSATVPQGNDETGKPMLKRATSNYSASSRPLGSVRNSSPRYEPVAGATVNEASSTKVDFVPPQDERAADPFERWKGCPLINWGSNGNVLLYFPDRIPQYLPGNKTASLKCVPGDMKIVPTSSIIPLSERVDKFPGPLKKNKRKDVLAWLQNGIKEIEDMLEQQSNNPDRAKLIWEKLLLWKVLELLVENEGVLEGSPKVDQGVHKILSLKLDLFSQEMRVHEPVSKRDNQELSGNPQCLKAIRDCLSTGDHNKAVWQAVDQGLWGHAMILSCTLSRNIWKQVVQEFVRKEIKSTGTGNEALAMLYETLIGNWEESVDQLVPASARAGFRMVSKNHDDLNMEINDDKTLAGLDKWQESLLLLMSNRTPGDNQSMRFLGRLLKSYSRISAAHVCFLFARPVTVISGIEDFEADISLLGIDPTLYGGDTHAESEIESILLTEVLEFALSLNSPGVCLPHLAGYKLYHAYLLAQSGKVSEAQLYVEAITAQIQSKPKTSVYYNSTLLSKLDDLAKLVSASSSEDSISSWLTRPNVDKVSESVWNKLATFVTGEEEDYRKPSPVCSGPFANVTSNTLTISRRSSQVDVRTASQRYDVNITSGHLPHVSGSVGYSSSRYTPVNYSSDTANTFSQENSLDSAQPVPVSAPLASPHYSAVNSSSGQADWNNFNTCQFGPYQSQHGQAHSQDFTSGSHDNDKNISSNAPNSSRTTEAGDTLLRYRPQCDTSDPSEVQQESNPQYGYGTWNENEIEQNQSTYIPPVFSHKLDGDLGRNDDEIGAGSTLNQKGNSSADDKVEGQDKPQRKNRYFVDDSDDDLVLRARNLMLNDKNITTNTSDSSSTRPSESEDKRSTGGNTQAKSSSWFGSWFKKDASGSTGGGGTGPIKAKLGEQNSFFYDTELKKWVNRNQSSTPASDAPTPPPPPPRQAPPPKPKTINANVQTDGINSQPGDLPVPSSSVPLLSKSETVSISVDSTAKTGNENGGSQGGTTLTMARSSDCKTGDDLLDELISPRGQGRTKVGGSGKGTLRSKRRADRYVDVMAQNM